MKRIMLATTLALVFFASPPLFAARTKVRPGKTLAPVQVWQLVRTAYLKRDFKAMYTHWSKDDQKKTPLKKFIRKIAGDYAHKVEAFKQLKFKAGKTYEKDGKRLHRFDFVFKGKTKKGGKMIFEGGRWKLYRFK